MQGVRGFGPGGLLEPGRIRCRSPDGSVRTGRVLRRSSRILLVVNGHPDDMITEYSANVSYKEPPLLFENRGGRFSGHQQEIGGGAAALSQQCPAGPPLAGDQAGGQEV